MRSAWMSRAEVEARLAVVRAEVARLEILLHTMQSEEASSASEACVSGHQADALAFPEEQGSRKETEAETVAVRGSATSYLGGPSQQDLNPGPKGKRSLNRGKGGVVIRKAKDKQKGGVYGADCYEESFWDPKVVLPALGIRPIGHIRTCFPRRNGCPRQGSVVPASRAKLELVFGSNPHHGLKGLEDFSHVWLLFLFDGNGTTYTPRPNVYPPRLLGKSKGVFATRSPHRPNPVGLSLCRIDAIDGRTLIMSGVDLVDGTPIIDIKPYIPCYDAPYANGEDGSADWGVEWARTLKNEGKELRYPEWCVPAAQPLLRVVFSPEAEAQLTAIQQKHKAPRVLESWAHVRNAIVQVLQADPRSVYRKGACAGETYPFFVDALDVRVIFDDDCQQARVLSLDVVPLSLQRSVPKAGARSSSGDAVGDLPAAETEEG